MQYNDNKYIFYTYTFTGYYGSPGALNNSQLDMYRSKRILEYDVRNNKELVVKEVKWMVRDATLIYRARVARNTKVRPSFCFVFFGLLICSNFLFFLML